MRLGGPAVGHGPGAPASPFRLAGFRVYWLGGVCSNSGTWLHNVTSSVLVFELTGSPVMVGILNFANLLPVLLLSLVGGVVSDRIDRRRLIVVASSTSAVVSVVLAVVTLGGQLSAGILVAASGLLGCGYAFAKPALSAMLPALVPRESLAHATAVNTLQFTVGQVVGSTLSTLVLALTMPWLAFAVNAVTFVGPIVAMVVLRDRVVQDLAPQRPGLAAVTEGMRFVFGPSGLGRVVAAIVLTNGVVEGIRTLSPVVAERALGLSADAAGWLVAGIGVGAAIGAAMFGRVQRRLGRRGLVVTGFGLEVAGGAIVALSSGLAAGVAGALLAGLGFAAVIPLLSAVMQERSVDQLRGRVMAVFAMAHLGMRPFISVVAGMLASTFGVRVSLLAFLATAGLALLLLEGGRRIDVRELEPSELLRDQ